MRKNIREQRKKEFYGADTKLKCFHKSEGKGKVRAKCYLKPRKEDGNNKWK